MGQSSGDGGSASRIFAVAALALAGLLFAATPISDCLDDRLLDLEWGWLREFAPRSAPEDVIVVGVDDASVAAIAEPAALWHESIGLVLARIASASPRAVGIEMLLPEKSYDFLRPGLDRALLTGMAAARSRSPIVAALAIDARTHSARPIFPPLIAVLGEDGLGVGILARDADGRTRRFSIALPTEDGSFPTFAGRLCRVLSRQCSDGLIDFALGQPLRYVSFKDLLQPRDAAWLEKLFKDRIVLVGLTSRYASRIDVPINLAGWESGGTDSPSIVVHGQSLRTALHGAPVEAPRPLAAVGAALAALVFLQRRWRLALAAAVLAAAVFGVAALVGLRGGMHVPLGATLATLVLACGSRMLVAWRK